MQYLLAAEGLALSAFNKPEEFLAHAGAHHVAVCMERVTGFGNPGVTLRTFATDARNNHDRQRTS